MKNKIAWFDGGALIKGITKYFDKVGVFPNVSKNADKKAKKQCALQLLSWIISGSSREAVTPPIKFGILRGSGSAFVGSELVGDSKGLYAKGTPCTRHSANVNTITVGFNTAYAARMHENLRPYGTKDPALKRGERSEREGDSGGKYIERHLKADGKLLMQMYAEIIKEETKK